MPQTRDLGLKTREGCVIPAYALARLAKLSERGRVRIAAEALARLVQQQDAMGEAFFFAEADRIVRGRFCSSTSRSSATG